MQNGWFLRSTVPAHLLSLNHFRPEAVIPIITGNYTEICSLGTVIIGPDIQLYYQKHAAIFAEINAMPSYGSAAHPSAHRASCVTPRRRAFACWKATSAAAAAPSSRSKSREVSPCSPAATWSCSARRHGAGKEPGLRINPQGTYVAPPCVIEIQAPCNLRQGSKPDTG